MTDGDGKLPHLQPVTENYDPFKPDTDNYAEGNFYVKSTDGKGHKDKIQVSVPPGLFALAMEITHKSELPDYKTVQDFVRDAMMHRAHFLMTQYAPDDAARQRIRLEMYQATIEAMDRELDNYKNAIQRTEAALDRARLTRDTRLLNMTLNSIEIEVSEWRDPYRSRMMSIINSYRENG